MISAAFTSESTTSSVSISSGLQPLVAQKYFEAGDGGQPNPDRHE